MSRAPIAGVLAGGAGTRLGSSKAGFLLAGLALVEYPLRAAAAAGLDAIVIAREDTPLPDVGVTVIRDGPGDRHPLRGIVTALDHAQRPVIAVACDMPLLTPGWLAWLATANGLVVPRAGGRLHPLAARYEPTVTEQLRTACDAGASVQATLSALGATVVEEDELASFGDPALMFFNVNTAQDAERATLLLG